MDVSSMKRQPLCLYPSVFTVVLICPALLQIFPISSNAHGLLSEHIFMQQFRGRKIYC